MKYYSFHTHTKRCDHAFGEDEEYIKEAISCAFSLLSFSDHVMFPNLEQKGTRGSYINGDFDDYLKCINSLKEKYKSQIEIHIGFEAEYGAFYKEYYQDLIKNNEIEYLLLGQHFYVHDNGFFSGFEKGVKGASDYVDFIIEGMKSGLFLYVAHPDLMVYFLDRQTEEFKELSRKLIRASKKYHTPLELNVSKVENNRLAGKENYEALAPFPVREFWEIAKEEKPEVIIGLDAHNPANINRIGFEYGLSLVKKYDLNLLEQDEILKRIKKIQKKIKSK